MLKDIELNAQIREDVGTNKLKTLRQKGFIPAIVYPHTNKLVVGVNGSKAKALPIQVNYKEFEKLFAEAGESTIIKLKIKNKKLKTKEEAKNVLIHDVAKDPVDDKFVHVDFLQVRMDKTITAEVGLVFEGEAPAVKNLEGILVKNITEVEVEALPKDLPHEIKVDISCLETFDDHIKIENLKLPQGVKILADSEEVIASVIPPRTKEELEELEEKVEEKVEPAVAEAEVGKEVEVEPSPEGEEAPVSDESATDKKSADEK